MPDTNINAYKAELVQVEVDLDRLKSRRQSLVDYIESVEPTDKRKSKNDESKKAKAQEKIVATDKKNETRPVVEDSLTDLPDEPKEEKIEVRTGKKGKK